MNYCLYRPFCARIHKWILKAHTSSLHWSNLFELLLLLLHTYIHTSVCLPMQFEAHILWVFFFFFRKLIRCYVLLVFGVLRTIYTLRLEGLWIRQCTPIFMHICRCVSANFIIYVAVCSYLTHTCSHRVAVFMLTKISGAFIRNFGKYYLGM